MGKRFADTNKYKKPFIRSLPGAYKIFWDFLYLDCDHSGIWIVDMTIAQTYVGEDMVINKKTALEHFNKDEVRIVEIDGGKKWFIVPFIQFQYGHLSEKNRAHGPVILALKKFDLIDENLMLKHFYITHTSPLEGAKEMEMEQEMEMDEGGAGETNPQQLCPNMVRIFKEFYPGYPEDRNSDYPACLLIAHKIANNKNWTKQSVANGRTSEVLLEWRSIVIFSKSDTWFSTRSISDFNKEYQRLVQKMLSDGTTKQSTIGNSKQANANAFLEKTKRIIGAAGGTENP